MLWAVALVAFLLWVVAFGVFHVAGGLFHAALAPALVAAIYDLVREQRRMAR